MLSHETSSMTEKKSCCIGLNPPSNEGPSLPIILLSSTDSSMGGSEMAGMTLSAVAFAAADAIELELSRRAPELELREMFSVLWRRIDHSRRGLSFEADL